MRKVWTIGAGLSAVAFILVGLGWLWAPGLVSPRLRMPLLEGDGLSTQIGDLAAFFLSKGNIRKYFFHMRLRYQRAMLSSFF